MKQYRVNNRVRSRYLVEIGDRGLAGAFLALVVVFFSSSCESIKEGLDHTRRRVASALQLGKGVPLSNFVAKDGDYFPEFIDQFFPGVSDYETKNKSIESASSGIQLIQVKRLSEKSGSYNEANLSWSADGVYLGYEIIGSDKRTILVKDLDGDFSNTILQLPKEKKSTFLSGMADQGTLSYNAGLRWSVDSTRFSFMSNGGVGEYNIYVGAVGSREKIIARSPSKDGFAAWSPTESEIVFVSSRSGNGDIYVVDAYGVEVKRLSSSDDVDIFPDWFPGGEGIVYASGDALDHDLAMIQKTKSGEWQKPVKLTSWTADELRPVVSPDGRFIAFYANSFHGNRIGKKVWNLHILKISDIQTSSLPLKADRLRKTIVAEDVVIDINTGPAFSPDSSKIFYVKKASKIFNPIEVYDLKTAKTTRIHTGTRLNRDVMISKLGVLSFRAQTGAWDRVYVALTNQGAQLQKSNEAFEVKYKHLSFVE